MIVHIYFPRLDCSFKKGDVPAIKGPPNHPIREYWVRFLDKLKQEHRHRGDDVTVLEIPLWQITPELVSEDDADIIYIPHKMKENFCVPGKNIRYYMQMVFPHLFSIDPEGWCASASTYPIHPVKDPGRAIFGEYQSRIKTNTSKFQQSHNKFSPCEKYVFFPCQIPHDETIRYHSQVSVEQALQQTLQWAKEGIIPKVVVKGHPMNPGSMEPLRDIAKAYNGYCWWVDDVSIHPLIANSEAVFTVNSGVGMEAILHKKPIFVFGNADYDIVCTKIIPHLIKEDWQLRNVRLDLYEGFIEAYVKTHYDVTKDFDFMKLP